MKHCSICDRRNFLMKATAGSAAFFTVKGAFAEALIATPSQTEGPFYPDKLPLDTDNDLIIVNDNLTPAVGTITHLTGTVKDIKGNALRNARVKIWQSDNRGSYIHSKSMNREKIDGNFQGFGQFLTDSKGQYYFRTIKPVPYVGRTPHIHVIVEYGGKKQLTTQLYIKGDPQNEKDGLFKRVKNPQALDSILVDFVPLNDKAGEMKANFDIVLGITPEDAHA